MLAVEAAMRAYARRFAPDDEELWGVTGLLHDLDHERFPLRLRRTAIPGRPCASSRPVATRP